MESLFVAYSGGAIEDDEGAFRRMFQTIGTLESAQTQGKMDANLLIGAVKKKVNAL